MVDSPYGVRAMAVRAAGPQRAALAAEVLRGFGELAMHETSIAGIAFRIDGFLAGRGEEYATAVLVEFDPQTLNAEVICCGHAPPLVVAGEGGAVECVLPVALPLGLQSLDAGWAAPDWVPLEPGDGLLLHTGGVSAAQRPFPFLARLSRGAITDPSAFVERLSAQLGDHCGDDVDLLFLMPETPAFRLRRPHPRIPTLGPEWSDSRHFSQ
ncbi:hypothetical protein GCM10022221_30910 [Actinocorallia aurea]